MAETKGNIPLSLMLTIAITLTGWGVTFGVCQAKIDTNAKAVERIENQHRLDIEKLETKQSSIDTLLQSINVQLVELNTKVTLILEGKVKKEGTK